MGWSTLLFAGLNAFKAVSSMKNASDQAKAITQNAANQARANQMNAQAQSDANIAAGNLATKERAKEIRYKAARQTASFLSSGLTLEGTPMDVIGETYTTGLEDLDLMGKNYNTNSNNIVNMANINNSNLISSANAQSKMTISAGRSEAINTIAGSFSNFDMGSLFGGGYQTGGSYAAPLTNSSGYNVGTYKV